MPLEWPEGHPLFSSMSFSRTSIPSATAVLIQVIGNETESFEPAARNSNLLPVKANGEVRLRSVLSLSRSGICWIPRAMVAGESRIAEGAYLCQCIGDLGQLLTEEDTDDGRRCFVCTQSKVIAVGCNGASKQICVSVNPKYNCTQAG